MKDLPILLILLLSFFGCQNVDQPEKPENLISKDKMVDILTETYLANASRSVDNKSIIRKGIMMDDLIYKNFGVDSLQFAKSNAFYAADVNTYMSIFQEVETRLDVKRKRMDSLWERERRIRDSIGKKVDIDRNIEPVKDSLI